MCNQQDNSKGTCDWCGEYKEIAFANITKQFCSAEHTNEYLKSEGVSTRVLENQEHQT